MEHGMDITRNMIMDQALTMANDLTSSRSLDDPTPVLAIVDHRIRAIYALIRILETPTVHDTAPGHDGHFEQLVIAAKELVDAVIATGVCDRVATTNIVHGSGHHDRIMEAINGVRFVING